MVLTTSYPQATAAAYPWVFNEANIPSSSPSTDSSCVDEFSIPSHSGTSSSITLTLNQETWLDALFLQANRSRLTDTDIFRLCVATIQAGGGDLAKFNLSRDTIRRRRLDFNSKAAKTIKVIITLSIQL